MVRSSLFKRLAVVSTMTLVALTAAACGGDDSSTADGGVTAATAAPTSA